MADWTQSDNRLINNELVFVWLKQRRTPPQPPPFQIRCLQGYRFVVPRSVKKTDFQCWFCRICFVFQKGRKKTNRRDSFSAHQPISKKPYFQAWIFRQRMNHICIWISSFVYLLFGLTLEGGQRRDYRNPLCHLHLSFKLTVNSANSALLITTTARFPWKHHFQTAGPLSPDCVLPVIKLPFSAPCVLQKSAEARGQWETSGSVAKGVKSSPVRRNSSLFAASVGPVLKGKVTLGGWMRLRLAGRLMDRGAGRS